MLELTVRSIQPITAGSPEENADNIRACLKRGLPEFYPTPCAHDGTVVIVGSGPTLPKMVEAIRDERRRGHPICAIKGAHDFLIEHGIEPDLFVSVEPRERPLKYTAERCCYMLASRCPPSLFDRVIADGRDVLVWHSWSSNNSLPPEAEPGKQMRWEDFNPLPECEVWRRRLDGTSRLGVGGGSTSGLRAINLCFLMGFRNLHMYGMDSCLAPDKRTKRFSGENIGESKLIDVCVDGKRFYCNGALAAQASEFQHILSTFKDMSIKVFGGGLLAAIKEARDKRGVRQGVALEPA